MAIDGAFDTKSVLKGNTKSESKKSDMKILDSDWIKSRFMVSDKDIQKDVVSNRYKSTASSKFTNTSWGGSLAINPRPQFTRYCDIRDNGLLTTKNPVSIGSTGSKNANLGMGRYYSEAIDDNTQTVFMEFGLPEFNSLSSFFFRAIDYNTSIIANSGRQPTMYNIGKGIGSLVMLAAFPIITIAVWTVTNLVDLFVSSRSYNYYYMNGQMHLYWSTVNDILSNIAVEMGVLTPIFLDKGKPKTGMTNIGTPIKIDQSQMDELKKILPDGIIGDQNYIDVFAIATKSQRLANEHKRIEYELINAGISFQDSIKQSNSFLDKINYYLTINTYIGDVMPSVKALGSEKTKGEKAKVKVKDGKPVKPDPKIRESDGTYFEAISDYASGKAKNFADAFDSSIRNGGGYAIFNVDYTGSVSESFSNSVGKINTGGTVKQISQKARNLKFDLAGGNVVGDSVKAVTDGAKDLITGALDSVSFGLSSVVQTLTGGGYIDLPKKWEDSSMSLPSITYNIQLVSPYGNTISQLQNIYMPIAMLLAGALPLSVGKSAYTSPFLCSLYSKGVQKINLGMITSLNLTRGTSNLGFSRNRRPLAIDVSFTVTDFSSLVSAPTNTSSFSGAFKFGSDEDTPFGNYISVLTSRDILTNKYAGYKAKLRFSKRSMKLQQSLSGYGAGMMGGNIMGDVLGGLVSVRSLTGINQNQ